MSGEPDWVTPALCVALREGGSAGMTVAQARRVVFGATVLAAARSRGRVSHEAHNLAESLAAYFLPTAEGGVALPLAALGQVYAAVGSAAAAASAEEIITAYERSLKWAAFDPIGGHVVADADAQHAAGAFFTPAIVADRLLDAGLQPAIARAEKAGPEAIRDLKVCDPASGPGSFLLAALRRLAHALARSASIPLATASSEVLRRCVYGVDLDVGAVELCRGLAWLETDLPWSELATLKGFRCGNSLVGATPALAATAPKGLEDEWCRQFGARQREVPFHWHKEFPEVFDAQRGAKNPRTGAFGGFDAVIGNPPFLNQLESGSAHAKHVRELLKARFSDATSGYTDTAVTFTLLGVELLREHGRCTLIAPVSILASRDAESARARWAQSATLESIWLATEYAFEGASVFVCAPTLRVGGDRRASVTRRRDLAFAPVDSIAVDMADLADAPTWSPLISDILGIPRVRLAPSLPTVGYRASASSDFRDQYYGLRGYVVEDATVSTEDANRFPPLVTTGLVELGLCLWGQRHTRYDKRRWAAPRVDLSRLDREGEVGPWARSKMVPKILLATQTRALEVVVDERGEWVPLIPLISVVPINGLEIWHLAAALMSPPLTAIAASTYLGTALTIDAVKLSAAQVRALPLPERGAAWDAAAALFRRAQHEPERRQEHIAACGKLMCEAYGLAAQTTAEVLAWWTPRAVEGSSGESHEGEK